MQRSYPGPDRRRQPILGLIQKWRRTMNDLEASEPDLAALPRAKVIALPSEMELPSWITRPCRAEVMGLRERQAEAQNPEGSENPECSESSDRNLN